MSTSEAAANTSGEGVSEGGATPKRKEIYTYTAPWTTYSLAWCMRPSTGKFKMAVGSYVEEYSNQFHIIQLQKEEEAGVGEFKKVSQFDHPYPATKVMFSPEELPIQGKDLLATTGDYLRLWTQDENDNVKVKETLNNNKQAEYCAPLTSFDWNIVDPTLIGVTSIDTTCTIWDIQACKPKTQLIAHDKEVYDIAFSTSKDIFGTVGADGSIRMFDLRSLEHSTILYESPDFAPLMKLKWNMRDPNYLATIMADGNRCIITDIR